jgi:hypothetical protein
VCEREREREREREGGREEERERERERVCKARGGTMRCEEGEKGQLEL